jgi:hypothetical protein
VESFTEEMNPAAGMRKRYSKMLTSPLPRRMTSGESLMREMTLEGWPETALPSMTTSTCLPK